MTEPPWAATLEQYRRAKWAELEDEGPDRLRIELAWLEDWLGRVDRGEMEDVVADVGFRRAKAAVLREILAARG